MAQVYRITKTVADAILSLKDVTIFGGYVRDMILHDHAAKAFYDHPKVSKIPTQSLLNSFYANPAFLPEFKDRLVIAKDIDCFMSTSKIPDFEEAIQAAELEVFKKVDLPISKYLANANVEVSDGLKLTRFKVGLKYAPLLSALLPESTRKIRVSIDVIHCDDIDGIDGLEPPFGRLDFECNALMLGKGGQIRASEKLFFDWEDPLTRFTKVAKVIEDIKKHKAVPVENPPFYRILHMMEKGWDIINVDGALSLISSERLEKDEDCLICLGNMKERKCHVLKRCCCNAKYHVKCFKSLVTNENFGWACPMCRSEIDQFEVSSKILAI
jgi:hypothetical protein